MNDSLSILLATSVLALGAFGFYLYKNSDEDSTVDSENVSFGEINDEDIFSENINYTQREKNEDKIYRKKIKTPKNYKQSSSRRKYQ